MQKEIVGLVLLLLTCSAAKAQSGFTIGSLKKISDDERSFLRKGFKLNDSAKIFETRSGLPKVPSANIVKINLESILDPKVREIVSNWTSEWNQKDAGKYGAIEMVKDGLQADITVVRYLRPLPTSDPVSAMTWTDPKGKVHRLLPVYSYLIVCKPDSLQILWRKVDLTYQEEFESSAKVLVNTLKRLIRERNKN
ncbi:MAG: hypothetical protein ABIU09_00540 [Pyrinomonadaceae bacterium]